MFSSVKTLWARITGGDIGGTFPQQQIEALGRVGNTIILFPYGHYCNLPDDTLVQMIAAGVALPVAVSRPEGVARNEPVFYHPINGSRIIFRNDGTIDIETDGASPVNINCSNANVTASGDVSVSAGGSASISATSITVDGDDVTIMATTFTVDAPTATFTGAIAATGAVSGSDLGAGGVTYKNHTHSQGADSNGDSQANTNPPIGA